MKLNLFSAIITTLVVMITFVMVNIFIVRATLNQGDMMVAIDRLALMHKSLKSSIEDDYQFIFKDNRSTNQNENVRRALNILDLTVKFHRDINERLTKIKKIRETDSLQLAAKALLTQIQTYERKLADLRPEGDLKLLSLTGQIFDSDLNKNYLLEREETVRQLKLMTFTVEIDKVVRATINETVSYCKNTCRYP